jgi:predicted MPP superfamily phosphohydrolase
MQVLIYWGSYFAFPALAYMGWEYYRRRRPAAAILFCLLVLFIWARFVEPSWIRLNRQSLSGSGHQAKIALISDMHVGVFDGRQRLARSVKTINKEKPDLVLIAGDFLFEAKEENISRLLLPLKDLKAPAFAILGNHDDGHPGKDLSIELKRVLESYNVQLLDNERWEGNLASSQASIIGFPDLWNHASNYQLLNGLDKDKLNILMIHNPDQAYDIEKDLPLSLTVAGHTHGGQIRLPGYQRQIPTAYDFDKGWYRINKHPLFITSGLGMVGLPFRFLCPPEIVIIELRP